jgi:hypothetical protein
VPTQIAFISSTDGFSGGKRPFRPRAQKRLVPGGASGPGAGSPGSVLGRIRWCHKQTKHRSQTDRACGRGRLGPVFGPFVLAVPPKPDQSRPGGDPAPRPDESTLSQPSRGFLHATNRRKSRDAVAAEDQNNRPNARSAPQEQRRSFLRGYKLPRPPERPPNVPYGISTANPCAP